MIHNLFWNYVPVCVRCAGYLPETALLGTILKPIESAFDENYFIGQLRNTNTMKSKILSKYLILKLPMAHPRGDKIWPCKNFLLYGN